MIAHFVIAGWHGATHQMVPVPLSTMQTAFVAIVIVILPLVGAAMSFSRWQLQGAAVVFASMLASAIFGLVYHFIVMSPDNIWHVPQSSWSSMFVSSAVLVLASELFGTVCGALSLRRLLKARA